METKVILLPENGLGSYSVIELPTAKDLEVSKPFLLQDSQLYELKVINGNNPHAVLANGPQLANSDGVRSWIFEDNDGMVVQSGNLVVTSKFNLCYLLLSLLYKNPQMFTQRFITIEDLLDKFSSLYGELIMSIPKEMLLRSLPTLCEIVSQDDEEYYKFSLSKANEFINEKVTALVKFIENGNNSLADVIMAKISDASTPDVPDNIRELAQLNYAIEFVCNSYTLASFKQQFIVSRQIDFTDLNAYLLKLTEAQKTRAIVEQSVNNIAASNANATKKNPSQSKKTTKKPTAKKVAVGKGALDGFFKKA
jgi:hypothetical protein